MRITAINGSPKGDNSNSMEMISMLRSATPKAEWKVVSSIREWRKEGDAVEALLDADAIVVAFPLYVDGLPSSLMALLERLGEALGGEAAASAGRRRKRRLYAAANCGFYEGGQNGVALEILANFAASCGLEWSGGIGIGTGEMLSETKSAPPEFFMRKPVTGAVYALASAIADGRSLEGNLFAQHGIPRWLFKAMGEAGWRRWIRVNGKKARDLDARPLGRLA